MIYANALDHEKVYTRMKSEYPKPGASIVQIQCAWDQPEEKMGKEKKKKRVIAQKKVRHRNLEKG
jgi:hypothetical protein